MQSPLAISPGATEEKLKQPMSTTAVDYYQSMVFSEPCQILKFLGVVSQELQQEETEKTEWAFFSVFSVSSC